MYAVIVTYGTFPNQVYAGSIPTQESAEALRKAAFVRGYRDARVMLEKDFYEQRQAYLASRSRSQAAA